MAYERPGETSLDYMPCRYGASKLLFRGPRRSLSGRYAAFLGGTETYGKFVPRPYPALVEARTGLKCVNFGWPNAGIDVFLNDADVLAAAANSAVSVLQVPPAQNMSNRFYRVHPRRNDRFLEASAMLRAIYPEVDFTEFHFNRHMLARLQETSPERFCMLREELQTAWRARMRLLIEQIAAPVILLWMSRHPMEGAAEVPDIRADPAFVTREMIDDLARVALTVVDATASVNAIRAGTHGMVFSEFDTVAAGELLGPAAHDEAAAKLAAVLADRAGPNKKARR